MTLNWRHRSGLFLTLMLCALGIYVAVRPVWSDWNSTQKSIAEYDLKTQPTVLMIDPDKKRYEDVPHDQVHAALQKGNKLAVDMLGPDGKRFGIPVDRVHDALNSGGLLIGSPQAVIPRQLTTSILPRPTFSLASAVTAHALRMLGGLAFIALAALSWVFRQIRTKRDVRVNRKLME